MAAHPVSIPTLTDEQIKELQSVNDEIRASALLNILGKGLPTIPVDYVFRLRDRKFVENAFNAAFDLVGGVPRLALWADQHPTEFYKLYSKLMPEAQKLNQGATQIIVQTGLQGSPLDDVTISVDGKVVGTDYEDVEP